MALSCLQTKCGRTDDGQRPILKPHLSNQAKNVTSKVFTRKYPPLLIGRKNGSKLWTPGKDSRVCSNHFVEGQPTVQNPLPTLNLGYDGYESRVKRILFLQEKPVQSEEELFIPKKNV
ncbi:hypothetical protein DPMN_118060 [Dreissena polymorpha]|uniref:THAP-type domain-containing protein n=1 Tax=Dreissena polymorpha TaxID=45954 RepID=A0A9D4JPW4_DREPO|nr:hypothetical protein DPMN_118060 [Dreissena polymorpha]